VKVENFMTTQWERKTSISLLLFSSSVFIKESNMIKKISIIILALAIGAIGVFAQGGQLRSAVSGQKYKIKGVVVSKDDAGTFIVRDTVGVDTRVVLGANASIKSNGFWGGEK